MSTPPVHPRSWKCSDRHCDCCGMDVRNPEDKMLCSGCYQHLCERCGVACRHEYREHWHVAPTPTAAQGEK